MKVLLILALSAPLALAGCHRDDASSAGRTGNGKNAQAPAAAGGSMQTPRGAATGQASEGSTDERKAPARPAAK